MAARNHASFRTAVNVREFHWFLTRSGGENRAVTEQINRFSLVPVEDWNTPVRLRVIPRGIAPAKFVGLPTHVCAIC
jgi:hypothetical protein